MAWLYVSVAAAAGLAVYLSIGKEYDPDINRIRRLERRAEDTANDRRIAQLQKEVANLLELRADNTAKDMQIAQLKDEVRHALQKWTAEQLSVASPELLKCYYKCCKEYGIAPVNP